MNMLLQRLPADGIALPGGLSIDGAPFSATLENARVAIPAGRYRVILSWSQRAHDGELWTSDARGRLPLICDVPGRDGLRIHALNSPGQSEGCIGVGFSLAPSKAWLGQSRAALIALLERLTPALDVRHEDVWLTVLDAQKPGMETKNA